MIVTPDILGRLLICDPETGMLTWRERSGEWFSAVTPRRASAICDLWNSRYAGRPALAALNSKGYRDGSVLGTTFKAHRVVWALAYGAWPEGVIDHIDHDKANNRLANLRCVTRRENNQNLPLQRNNKTGFSQVYRRGNGRWLACARVNGGTKQIGRFDTFEEAVAARKQATERLGYHPNHGRALDAETAAGIGVGVTHVGADS